MNIEEARKHLKKNLNNWKKSKKDNGYMPEIMEEINTDYEAIETLLTAYEKEKEKNKRLMESNPKWEEHYWEGRKEGYDEANSLWKEKIKPIQIIDLDGKIHNVYKIEEE